MARRFGAQLLAAELAADAAAVAGRLLAVQAQDTCGRTPCSPRAHERALPRMSTGSDEGRVVVGWLNRGTLHLVCREDYWWLHALTTPPLLTGNARRLAQAESRRRRPPRRRGGRAGSGARARSPRRAARARVEAAQVPTAGQALVPADAGVLRGLAVRGPFRAAAMRTCSPQTGWGGRRASTATPRSASSAALPPWPRSADDRDLAKWAGLPLQDARAGLAARRGEPGSADGGPFAPVPARPVGPGHRRLGSRAASRALPAPRTRSALPAVRVDRRPRGWTWSAAERSSSSRSCACGAPCECPRGGCRRYAVSGHPDGAIRRDASGSGGRHLLRARDLVDSSYAKPLMKRPRRAAKRAGTFQPRVPARLRRVAYAYLLTRRLERARRSSATDRSSRTSASRSGSGAPARSRQTSRAPTGGRRRHAARVPAGVEARGSRHASAPTAAATPRVSRRRRDTRSSIGLDN